MADELSKRKKHSKSPEIVATETLIAILSSNSMQEAADQLNISRQAVYMRVEKYDLTDKIKQLREEALLELQLGTGKAARRLVKLVDSDNDGIAKAASDSILDRVGLTKLDKKDAPTGTNIFVNGDANFSASKYKK